MDVIEGAEGKEEKGFTLRWERKAKVKKVIRLIFL